ncbi:MAG: branched-chain amino acid ABC transporter permease [Ignavibacteria bacterium]|nr:branched-chain amino acid ABC transporter permease [Ignavibacteria bacterium]
MINTLPMLLLSILISSSLVIFISYSFLILYLPTRFFHIAHAVVITLGAYFTYLFFIQLQLSLFIAIPLAIIFSTLIGVLCELIVYKPMREKNLPPLAYLIASIGLYVVLQNIISLVSGDDTKTLRTGEVRVGNEFLGAYITDIQIIIIAVSLVLFILVLLFNKYSKTGKAIRAVSANPELSNIFGINSNKIILISFAIGSALGSVAGILSAFDTNMTPTMGFNLLLYGVVAMIIGGVGSYKGLIGGALLVASAQHLAAYYIDTKWMDAVAYIILILFLIWKPLGFSGQRLKKVEI